MLKKKLLKSYSFSSPSNELLELLDSEVFPKSRWYCKDTIGGKRISEVSLQQLEYIAFINENAPDRDKFLATLMYFIKL